jgi:hypothetical protein
MTKYSEHHGGPYDRGSADAYYRRDFDPHYWTQGTGGGVRVKIEEGAPEYEAYDAGYKYQVQCGDFKDWGD